MTQSGIVSSILLGVVLVCLNGGPAMAEPPAESSSERAAAAKPVTAPLSQSLIGMAKAEFDAAKILYQDNDFANALVKFKHAYELSSNPRMLWNIAACEKNLRRYARALTAIEDYQRKGGDSLTEEDRRDAADVEKVLRPLVSAMRLVVSEPGADIFVDNEKIGTSPLLAPVLLDVGEHIIRIRKPGFKDVVMDRTVEGGTAFSLVIQLTRDVHRGRVLVTAGPGALIAIDGRAVAQGRWEGSLPSGGHTLRVTAPGMATYQSELFVEDDRTRKIDVFLNPIAKTGDSTWAWIAGGAALAAATILGGALLFEPTEAPVSQGTLGTFPLSFGVRK